MEVKSARPDMKSAESVMRASHVSSLLSSQFGGLSPIGMSPALAMSPAMPFSLGPTSPYSKKIKSSPAAAIPQLSKNDADNTHKSNELLNQDLLKLQSQAIIMLHFDFSPCYGFCFL
jgi:hypothetical protein